MKRKSHAGRARSSSLERRWQGTETLDALMPELFLCSTGLTLGAFAKGLIDATTDSRGLWDRLVAPFGSSDPKTRSPELLACFLFNLRSVEPELTETVLDEVLNHPLLSEWFPSFQGRVGIVGEALPRLKQSLADGKAPTERYRGLGWPAHRKTSRSWNSSHCSCV
jgi:hypothetical protein